MLRLAGLFLLLAFSCLALSAGAALDPRWVVTYTTGQSIDPAALAVDAAGNSFVVSTVEQADEDIAITKFDSSGAFVWQQLFTHAGSSDRAVDVVLDAAETAVYGVARGVPAAGGSSAVLIYKLDAVSGDLLWDTFWRSEGSSLEDPRDAAATPDGGLAITGGSWRSAQRLDFATLKLDAGGSLVWEHTYDDGGQMFFNSDRGDAIAVAADGDVVVTGTSQPPAGGSDILTFRFDGASGDVEWQARYTTSADETSWDLAIAPDGDAVVLGTDPFGVDLQWLILRYEAGDGQEVWNRLIDPGFDDFPRAVATDPSGNVYAAGRTDPDGDDSNGNDNLIVLSLDGGDGTLRWLEELGGEGFGESDHASSLLVQDGRLYVAGESSSETLTAGSPLNLHALLLELATESGQVIDTSVIDTTADPDNTIDDAFSFLAADATGHLYAAGRTYDDPDPADGELELARFATGRLFADGFESGDTLAWSESH